MRNQRDRAFSSEVHRARQDLSRSRGELERSLDEFKAVAGEQAERVMEIRTRARRVAETAREPSKLVGKLVEGNGGPLREMLIERRTQAERYLAERARDFQHEADRAIDSTFQNLRVLSRDFIADFGQAAERGLRQLDTRPLQTWLSVFVSGVILGVFFARRASAAGGRHARQRTETEESAFDAIRRAA